MWEEINNIIPILQNGGTILYPTDTIWGLGCDATNEEAIAKIYKIKNRLASKSMIILLAEPKDILHYVAAPHPDTIDIVSQFEKPTTVIFDNAINLPDILLADDGSIGIRITKNPFCKAIIKQLQKPLVSTSANISGAPPPTHFSNISQEIIDHTDYVCNYGREDNENRPPSTIIKINEDGSIIYLRK